MNSNPVRLGRYAYLDHVSSEERLLFTQRRWWKSKLFWYPIITLALALYYMPTFGAESVSGKTKNGMAFVITTFESGPLVEFRVYLSSERR